MPMNIPPTNLQFIHNKHIQVITDQQNETNIDINVTIELNKQVNIIQMTFIAEAVKACIIANRHIDWYILFYTISLSIS